MTSFRWWSLLVVVVAVGFSNTHAQEGVARDTGTAPPSPPPPQPRPNAGEGRGPVPGVLPSRPTIARPDFDCGRPYTTTTTTTNNRGSSRQTRAANPQTGSQPDIGASQAGGHDSSEPPQVFCGASPISDRFLLTSATCVLDPNRPLYSVRLGALTTSENESNLNSRPVDYDIKQIIVHPEFVPDSTVLYNDVALIETFDRIQFNEYVFPYCVTDQVPPPGATVIGAGFGLVNETHSASHLQEADLAMVETDDCQEQYMSAGQEQRLRTAYPNLLKNQDVLCAGFPGRGACKGDEGGPLYAESAGRRVLVGIVSFTGPCSKDDLLPGVYTSVARHIPFIDSVIYELL